ncbi:MAG: GNAT family N-acetyltransferase [Lachnospiraceae bacterium]|nr:GNAT family N-acetyltransferase [Lachnospiraceae bacterium]
MDLKVLIVYFEKEKFSSARLKKQMEEIHRLENSFLKTIILEKDNINEVFLNANPKESILITTSNDMIRQFGDLGYPIIGFEVDETYMTDASYVYMDLDGIEYDDLLRVFQRFYDIPWTIFETSRCVVREFAMDDLDELEKMYATPGFTDYVEPLYSHDLEREYERKYIDNIYRFYGFGMWLVFHKETGEMIGRAGIEFREDCDYDELELGYAFVEKYQGQGIATEVCKAIIDYAREKLEIRSMICRVSKVNSKSIHFIEKLGFKVREEDAEQYIYNFKL